MQAATASQTRVVRVEAGDGAARVAAGAPGWHEQVYKEARGDAARVPWAALRAHPLLVEWLNRGACEHVRPGSRALVVGSGLGDDVAEMRSRGFDAVGLEVSPTAVEWSRRRWPELEGCFVEGDASELPAKMRGRFDLVVEVYTVQSVEPRLRGALARGIASARHPRGCVLAVCTERDAGVGPGEEAGPPWGLSEREMVELWGERGLVCAGAGVERFAGAAGGAEKDGRGRLRGVFVGTGGRG
jgi:SAM-dependent methyltransferase